MSQYEGWSNRETFMVASIIDNDRAFLDHVMGTVEYYIVNNMEPQLPSKLAYITRSNQPVRKQNAEAEAKDYLLIMLRLRSELHHLILETFFDQVDWDELAEHYKTKYVENLVNDKNVLTEIAKGKESKYHSEPNLNPEFKDPIMNILQSIDSNETKDS